ncbi:hypothetical protein TVAG_322580 [Trichomonas vaginalis G3]|uniref:DNA-directed RNA polymerase III subunit RPC3 n=1 Tax=Trichomonas vaginalis (strain ATCC PRA-98 / G3) TaxID=412133 RepID=A2EL10_TRIV3|nr:RNA polymerase III DNA directed -related family [Trichomonas vaginalis G3]EAY06638.1 hypothetical protein TVAG_322580 [Trichomonas vaginalis G3]KAI5552903.1 RNA polymerase III DNA directed -related family [Trichomonas vaginalis G3]|eukprot:XP_001318861.1 hypothetical protein [Trichomonas vaginalis G3]
MQDTSKFWGENHDQVLFKLCTELVRQQLGEDCAKIVEKLSEPVQDEQSLMNLCNMDQLKFRNAFGALSNAGIVTMDPTIAIIPVTIISYLTLPHFMNFAQKFYIIPQDRDLIEILTTKIIKVTTLTAPKLVDTLATEDPKFDRIRALKVTQHLIAKKVFILTDKEEVNFNIQLFLVRLRLEALEKLVEYQDHRVVEVIRALFSPDFKEDALIDCESLKVDHDEIIQALTALTGMQQNEIIGVLGILSSPDICLFSRDFTIIQPMTAIHIFRIKRIAALLAEIGHPLARRVINMLLKNEQIETIKFCDMLMLPKQDALNLLATMQHLGVITCEELEDAPHTTLKRKYRVWKIDLVSAINNAGAYLLAVIGSLMFQVEEEKRENRSILDSKPELSQKIETQTSRVMSERLKILNNTIIDATKKYFEIHQL